MRISPGPLKQININDMEQLANETVNELNKLFKLWDSSPVNQEIADNYISKSEPLIETLSTVLDDGLVSEDEYQDIVEKDWGIRQFIIQFIEKRTCIMRDIKELLTLLHRALVVSRIGPNELYYPGAKVYYQFRGLCGLLTALNDEKLITMSEQIELDDHLRNNRPCGVHTSFWPFWFPTDNVKLGKAERLKFVSKLIAEL